MEVRSKVTPDSRDEYARSISNDKEPRFTKPLVLIIYIRVPAPGKLNLQCSD